MLSRIMKQLTIRDFIQKTIKREVYIGYDVDIKIKKKLFYSRLIRVLNAWNVMRKTRKIVDLSFIYHTCIRRTFKKLNNLKMV